MGIALENVSFTYQEGTPLASTALSDVSLTIEDGSYTALIGHTGSGKSTILQLLNGLLVPSQGSVRVFDTLITSTSKNKDIRQIRKQVGLVFQFAENQIFEETVLKDVAFGPQNFGVSEEDAEQIAREKLALVGIDESLFDRSPFELSGGQMRRIELSRLLLLKPDIVIFDEPAIGLDIETEKVIQQVLEHHFSTTTVFIIAHRDSTIRSSARRIYLESGHLIKDDSIISVTRSEVKIDQ